ncbi:helix-turn-helix domain-containing protein [Salinibacter ruber]|mgnify:FL=1|uniref:DNA-binding XRE family transcriptional regulator n=1 Tax=Salinibacter ruber TaxID=146919 RepID=A0AAW5P4C2_9BACT|nr:helix-turn-helix domain-containing protein [Salinibacter ruber]MCS4156289.1 DNA-binding XRE family transcriptional regulator [Salinibacter ruber]MCS4223911.1 DNA-binding XRE family transcriptional regulator [Salinibacter ruber]
MTDAPPNASHEAPSMTPEDLAERARELREDSGLTQRDLADKIECAPSTISKAENYHEGDGMISARITIIEALTGETIEGPFYG